MKKRYIISAGSVLMFMLFCIAGVSAKLYITSYCDVALEACKSQEQALELLEEKYPYDIQVEYLYYFDTTNTESSLAQIALECANRQGLKEAYKQELQNNLNYFQRDNLKEYAENIGLVAANFSFCLDTQATAWDVLDEVIGAADDGVVSAPSVRFNMDIYAGSQTFTSLHGLVKEYLEINNKNEEEKETETVFRIEIPDKTGEGPAEEIETLFDEQEQETETPEEPSAAGIEEPLFFRVIKNVREWMLSLFQSEP